VVTARIPPRDLVRAALEFALPQIQIVGPKIVICLGLATFSALRRACGETQCHTMDQAIASPFALGTARVWCQAHTGVLGRNNRNRGGVDRVSADWQRMKTD
jgi:uracil-DNA glycosylase